MLLSQNERFLNEYKRFSSLIAEMQEGDMKIEMEKTLTKLVTCVSLLDQHFVNATPNNSNTDTIKNLRQDILSSRKKLSTMFGVE